MPSKSFKHDRFSNHSHSKTFNMVEPNMDNLLFPEFDIGLDSSPVSVVIDGKNLHTVTRTIGAEGLIPNINNYSIDFYKLGEMLEANFPNLKRKFYVTSEQIVLNENNNERKRYSSIRPLLDFLRYHRYVVRSVAYEMDRSDEDIINYDGLVDVEITTAIFEAAKLADHVIFFGSHRKFHRPLQHLFDSGKTITVVSTHKTENNRVHDSLRQIDHFVDLATPSLAACLNKETSTRRDFYDEEDVA